MPEPAQGFLNPPGDQIAIWSRFERYCRACLDLRRREMALYVGRVELMPILGDQNKFGYQEEN